MALHIREDILAKYGEFYSFALEKPTENTLIINGQAELDALDERSLSARKLAVYGFDTECDFAFLYRFKRAENIGIFGCKALKSIWDISRTPSVRGIAICNCKHLANLDTLTYVGGIEHIFISGKSFNAPCVSSLAPLTHQKSLLTLDLAVRKCHDKRKIAFNTEWPQLEALTISPNMRIYFKSESEV